MIESGVTPIGVDAVETERAMSLQPAMSAGRSVQRRALPHAALRWSTAFSTLCVITAALVIWRVFYPAIMSLDSISQYEQALTRSYSDWHPPLMSIILALVLSLGGTIGTLMLVQCIAGCLAVWYLALTVLTEGGTERRVAEWAAVGVLFFLLLPLTPLAFYVMTFWKDVWLAILLLWILALALRLRAAPKLTRQRFLSWTLALSVLMAFSMMLRHNAIVLVAPYSVVLFMILWPRRGRAALLLALLPIVLFAAGSYGQNVLFAVKHDYPEQQVMALDLVGILVNNPSLRVELPYTGEHLRDDYRDRYKRGDVTPLLWETPNIVDNSYLPGLATQKNDSLAAEYEQAINRFPLEWTRVKVQAYLALIDPGKTFYWFQVGIHPNGFALVQHRKLEKIRNALVNIAAKISRTPLRWWSGVHLVWMVVCLGEFLSCLAAYFRRREGRWLFYSAVLAIPLAYYGSYLAAVTALDFRFMYPATLAVQVLTLSSAMAVVLSVAGQWRTVIFRASLWTAMAA